MSQDVDVFLEHFGVKGMKWGVRNDRSGGAKAPGVSRSVNRHAQKDAKEFARAKAFYGEGAGIRRKLIKQTIEGKSKRMPGYKEALDYHIDLQDPSKHASKAVSERKRTDRKKGAKQTLGAVARRLTGEMGTKAAFTAIVISGAAFLKSQKGQMLTRKYSSIAKDKINQIKMHRGANHISDYLKRQGL